MTRCAHCGINLAKVTTGKVVSEYVRLANEPRGEYRLRDWCSFQCRAWWMDKHKAQEKPYVV